MSATMPEAGPSRVQAAPRTRMNSGSQREPRIVNPVLPRLLTVQQAATLAGVSDSTVRSWLDYGRLKSIRLPSTRPGRDSRIVRVEREELERLIAASAS